MLLEVKTVLPNADFMIEGYVNPHDEGPFGDRGKVGSANSEVLKSEFGDRRSEFGLLRQGH